MSATELDVEVEVDEFEERRAVLERRRAAGFYVDPLDFADIDAAVAERDAADDPTPPAPDVYIDPQDGVPAAPMVAPAGQVLITNPDLPGEPVGACFPEALVETWARAGWVAVDPDDELLVDVTPAPELEDQGDAPESDTTDATIEPVLDVADDTAPTGDGSDPADTADATNPEG